MASTLNIKRELEIPKSKGLSSSTQDKLIHGFFFLNGMVSVIALMGIFGLLVYTSIPAFQEINLWAFLTGAEWNPTSYYESKYGIVPMLVSTLMVTAGALVIAIPLGIGTAAYLSDVASPRAREIIKPIIEILAGIPSVVIGFLGIVLLGPVIAKVFGISNGLNAVNGSILLAVMALPTIISISEDALNGVPKAYDQASLALGASRWQTVIRVKIPAAMSGIIAACMLGMGRAIGETMTVLMATGCAPAMPGSFLESVRTLTSSIAIELGEVAYNTTHYYALFALGLVLFIITFLINLTSDIILHRYEKVNR
ncbi:MAG: phosphate ABC transporter permease subunit PstC [Candidatus Omnitrophica bacterium]|nr:phosphate ABC transporter permease subunit PstC [Candidatus Omnitrophota bacterium]